MDSPERPASSTYPRGILLLLVWSTAWVFLLIPRSSAQSPPRLSSNAQEIRRVVPSGTVIQLPCPVEASDPSSLLFEWYKDRRPITTFAEVRFRVGNSGTLKIKGVLPEDMGHYVCRAVNGYGSVEVNATLIVLADDDYEESTSDSEHQSSHGDNVLTDTDAIETKGNGAKPAFIHVTKFNQPIVHKPVGSSVRLKCVASGNPRPHITWLKNGYTFQSGESSVPSTKRGRWTLNLQNLQTTDSGNYTCIVRNPHGVINASFVIDVVDRVKNKPEITGSHPVNTTVEVGSDAVFQCRVKSDDSPHIQWLKHVDSGDVTKEDRQKVANLQGEFYRILKNSEVLERPDGTFLNKLLIPDAKESDTGKYVCLSVNTIGFIHRSAFLTVLPKNRAPSSIPEEASSFPLFIVIAVITTTAVLLASAMALLLHCRFKKSASPPPPIHRTHHHSSQRHHHHHSKTSSSSVGTMETNPVYMPAPSVPEIMVDKMVETTRTYSPPQPHFHRHHPTPYGYYC